MAKAKKQQPEPLSWEPIRKGALYCAPACGHGCTYAEYRNAVKKGEALATLMGSGWHSRVWENLGWHWEVVNDAITLAVGDLDSALPYHVNIGGRFCAAGVTPAEAIQEAYSRLRAEKDKLDVLAAGVAKILRSLRQGERPCN